jgi:hypothetical protein
MAEPRQVKAIKGGLNIAKRLLADGENEAEAIAAITAAQRAEAGRKGAALIKSQPQVKASEALGQQMEKGVKRVTTTQADRTRVGGGNIGGAPFSAISEADPNYAGKVWGVMDEGTAARLKNLTDPETVWTTMLGSANQLKTNPVVFDKLKRQFIDSMKQGNLSPELEAKINHNLALTFGEGAQIRDPKIWREANTFEKRAALADLMMGQGITPKKGGVPLGGEKSGKGVIFRPTDTLKRETEPSLLHTEYGGDVPTFAAGPRLFKLEKESVYRPDLHPGFPTLLTGKDMNVNMIPTPTEIFLPDWHKAFKEKKPERFQRPWSPEIVQRRKSGSYEVKGGEGPGYYDLALGLEGEGLPSQALNDEYIRHLLREGFKDGGGVDIDAADRRLSAAIQKRMAKGGEVDMEAADARLADAIAKRTGMAEGGEAGFKKIQFMADGGIPHMAEAGKVVKGMAQIGKRLLASGEEAPKVDRLSMSYKDVTKRVPEVADALEQLVRGEITKAQYNDMVKLYKPVTPYTFVPKPATKDEAVGALRGDAAKERYGKQSEYEPGSKVGLRLDIPAYTGKGVWVNSIHNEKAKKVAYGPTASVKNADLSISQAESKRIALGGAKAPYARIKGEWNPMSDEEAIVKAQEYLNHPEWRQIGMDPERHSYFYDRATMQPITNAEEIIQIGPLVLGKNPKYANFDDFDYAKGGYATMLPFAKGGKIVKGGLNVAKRLMADNSLPTIERDANLAKFLEPSKVQQRLYHGTGQGDISAFKLPPSKKVPPGYMWGQKGDETYNRGVFLSPNPEMANHFAKRGTKLAEDDAGQYAVYPVRAQVERPFDYENPEHREMLAQFFQKQYDDWHKSNPEAKRMPDVNMEYLLDNPNMNFQAIESPEMLHAIERLGFDSFYTSEGKAKNIGVFDPRKIKSDIGNRGTYDINEADLNKAHGGLAMAKGGKLAAIGKIGKRLMADAPQAEALKLAQQRAALPPAKGGLGLPKNNTPQQRAEAMNRNTDAYHGSKQDITGAFKPGYDDNLAFVTKSPDFANKWIGKGKIQKRAGAEGEAELKSAEDLYRALKEKHMDFESLDSQAPNFHAEYDKRNSAFKEAVAKEMGLYPDKTHSTVYPLTVQSKKIFNPETDMNVMAEFFAKNNTPPQNQELYKSGNYLMYETKPVVEYLKSKGYDSMRLRESTGDDYPTIAVFNPESVRSKFAAHDPFRKDAATAIAMGVAAPDLLAEEEHKAKGGKIVKGGLNIAKRLLADPTAPRSVSEGDIVNGMMVRKDIPNASSIGASLSNYSTHGLQEVPMSAFQTVGKPKYYSAQEEKRTKELARQIQENKELNPLIVVKDAEGHYILEGGHRFDALRELGIDSFPALMVHDLESLGKKLPVPPVAKAEGGGAFKKIQFMDKGGITTSAGSFSPEELGVSADEIGISDKRMNQIKRNIAKELGTGKEQLEQEYKQLGSKGGKKDFAIRVGSQFLGGGSDLINLGLEGLDLAQSFIPAISKPESVLDTAGTGDRVPKFKLASDRPFLGSQHFIDKFKEAKLLGDNEFPVSEIVAGFAAPAAAVGALKKSKQAYKGAKSLIDTPKKRRGGLTAMAR